MDFRVLPLSKYDEFNESTSLTLKTSLKKVNTIKDLLKND